MSTTPGPGNPRQSRRRDGLRAALPVALALASAACTASPPHTGQPPSSALPAPSTPPAALRTPFGGLPDPRKVDHNDATAVSRTALTIMFSVDSAIDRGQRDAFLRAADYLTPELVARFTSMPIQAVPATWRDHRAYSRPRLKMLRPEEGAPADTTTTASRQWEVTIAPVGRDRWHGGAVTLIVFLGLTRPAPDGPWKISGFTT